VPAEAAVLARALALVPQDRWRSCTEMLARLQFCLEEVKVPV
jgi:hypothetical protein